MYLFDTDVMTNVLKKKPSQILLKRLKYLPAREQFISVITIAEIVYGAEKNKSRERHLNDVKKMLLPEVQVLDFDFHAAYLAGRIRAALESMGMPLSFSDTAIAAIAISNGLTLITGNTKHFTRIPGLRIENWLI